MCRLLWKHLCPQWQCSLMVAAVSHFLELDAELVVLGSIHCIGMMEDEVDALWT
jgi:hypothetical protein